MAPAVTLPDTRAATPHMQAQYATADEPHRVCDAGDLGAKIAGMGTREGRVGVRGAKRRVGGKLCRIRVEYGGCL